MKGCWNRLGSLVAVLVLLAVASRAPTQIRIAPVSPSVPLGPVYVPPVQVYIPPIQTYIPPIQTYTPPLQTYTPPLQAYTPPVQVYTPPTQGYTPPSQPYTPPQTYTPPTTYNPPSSTPSTSPSVTPSPAPSPAVDPEVARREEERRALRGLIEKGLNGLPVETLQVLKEKGKVLDPSDRAALAGRAVESLRAKVERVTDPWEALRLVERARQAEWSDISGSLAELQRSVEPRCLTDLLNEVARLIARRDWTSAQKLIAERLAKLPSLGSVQAPLGQAMQAARQADRLDRLTAALNSSETNALETWQRVPLHRLPPNLQSRATGLRGLVAVEAGASAAWVTPPDVDDLKRDLKEFSAGPWDPALVDKLQFSFTGKAIEKGHGTVALNLFEDLGDRVSAEDAAALTRNMTKAARQALAQHDVPPPDHIRYLFPAGKVGDVEPGVEESGLGFLKPLKVAKQEVPSVKNTLQMRIQAEVRDVRKELEQALSVVRPQARSPLPTLFSTGGGGGPPGPNDTILPVYVSGDDEDKKKLLARLGDRLGSELCPCDRQLALRLQREGETEDDILALLKDR